MRALLERLILVICSLAFAVPSPHADSTAVDCISKELMAGRVFGDYPDAISTDLDGEFEQIFLAGLSRVTGEDMLSYDVVFYRAPGKSTTLIIFFKDGCADKQAELPNNVVSRYFDRA